MGLIRTQDGKEDQENMVAAPLSSYVSATCPLVKQMKLDMEAAGVNSAICLRVCYAMPGTDMMSVLNDVRY
eukprot:3941747-Rhodomonas_salina.6